MLYISFYRFNLLILLTFPKLYVSTTNVIKVYKNKTGNFCLRWWNDFYLRWDMNLVFWGIFSGDNLRLCVVWFELALRTHSLDNKPYSTYISRGLFVYSLTKPGTLAVVSSIRDWFFTLTFPHRFMHAWSWGSDHTILYLDFNLSMGDWSK